MDRKSGHEISIALCTYNGQQFLQEQLESIAAQTLLPTELVACDDGSNDLTIDILNEFARNAPFEVRIIKNSKNLGATRNFEQAISLCSGELIALCDQDDWWAPQKLETLRDALLSDDAGAVFSDARLMDADSHLIGKTLWNSIGFNNPRGVFHGISGRDRRISELLRRNVVTGATAMIRADCRKVILPIPPVWIHDGWIAWMMVLHATIISCPKPLIHYRIHGNQQVGTAVRPIGEFLRRRRSGGDERYGRQADQFQILLEHIKRNLRNDGLELGRKIRSKRDFMRFRADLGQDRLSVWTTIIGHFSDYRLYALGLRSMILDALR